MTKMQSNLLGSAAVPEVIEGNQESDWALWEDSVAFQDSQINPVVLPAKLVPRHDASADAAFADAFASVNKNTP